MFNAALNFILANLFVTLLLVCLATGCEMKAHRNFNFSPYCA